MRTRREFSDEYKRAAVARLATEPLAEVAHECGVSVSVMHRWRKQWGHHRAEAAGERRTFSKEFKRAAVMRLEAGEGLHEAAAACGLHPEALRRWRAEWRRYGDAAFSGYGKARTAAGSSQTVVVRFTDEEYERLKEARGAAEAKSLPAFVRARVLEPAPSVDELVRRLEGMVGELRAAAEG